MFDLGPVEIMLLVLIGGICLQLTAALWLVFDGLRQKTPPRTLLFWVGLIIILGIPGILACIKLRRNRMTEQLTG